MGLIHISNLFPGDADTVGLEIHFENCCTSYQAFRLVLEDTKVCPISGSLRMLFPLSGMFPYLPTPLAVCFSY